LGLPVLRGRQAAAGGEAFGGLLVQLPDQRLLLGVRALDGGDGAAAQLFQIADVRAALGGIGRGALLRETLGNGAQQVQSASRSADVVAGQNVVERLVLVDQLLAVQGVELVPVVIARIDAGRGLGRQITGRRRAGRRIAAAGQLLQARSGVARVAVMEGLVWIEGKSFGSHGVGGSSREGLDF
jgi:hypothetical protein